MVVEWEARSGLYLSKSGVYAVSGTLQLVEIDCERDVGCYIAPNVWMRRRVAAAD